MENIKETLIKQLELLNKRSEESVDNDELAKMSLSMVEIAKLLYSAC